MPVLHIKIWTEIHTDVFLIIYFSHEARKLQTQTTEDDNMAGRHVKQKPEICHISLANKIIFGHVLYERIFCVGGVRACVREGVSEIITQYIRPIT